MPTEVEGTHQIGDVSLYTKTWKVSQQEDPTPNIPMLIPPFQPDGPPVAKVIFIHGFNDHINRYYDLFPTLAFRGIETLSFDQRGWGRSVKNQADKGLTGPTSLVISDIVSFIKTQLPSPVPVFVMGHSMGGGEALTLASDPLYEDVIKQIRGWILESPFIAFPKGFAPNFVTIFFGKLAAKALPKMQRISALPPENLTRDPNVVKSMKEDTLLHDYGTLQGLEGMLHRAELLDTGKAKLSPSVNSVWLGHGTEDKGTSYEASKKWIEAQTQLDDKEFKSYTGWAHQLHADLPETQPVFAKDVGDWILARVGSEVQPAVQSKF